MPKAIRYASGGKFLKNTLFFTQADYLCAYHADTAVFDATLAAEEEALSIESHKQDFAAAFGIPADKIEAVAIPWDGDPETLPKEDEPDAHVRLPVAPPPARESTLEEKIAALLAATPAAVSALAAGAGEKGGV